MKSVWLINKKNYVLHLINIIVGMILFYLVSSSITVVFSYYISFIASYYFSYWLIRKLFRHANSFFTQIIICNLFIFLVGVLSLTLSYFILADYFVDDVVNIILAAPTLAIGVFSLGYLVFLWPICLGLSFVNYIFLKKGLYLTIK
jgi:hypothetical protein